MGKGTYFIGQPVFTQLLSLLPKDRIRRIAKATKADRYNKSFDSLQHLGVMLYALFSGLSSLRETTTALLVYSGKLNHMGLNTKAARSTLIDANERRPIEFFRRIYELLYKEYGSSLSDSRSNTIIVDHPKNQTFLEMGGAWNFKMKPQGR